MADFFAEYPKFFETSQTTATPSRLGFRYNLIIEQNKDIFAGKSVVEMASHDGRWAFAALKAGAKSVHGVEARQHLVDNAYATFEHYGIPKSDYEFVCRDGYREMEDLERAGRKFDTALILGFLYHTAKPYEIIERMSKLDCSAIVLDTSVLPHMKRPFILLGAEKTEREGNASGDKPMEIVSLQSLLAIEMMLKALGFQTTVVKPSVPIPVRGCLDYRRGRRLTVVGRR